MQQEIVSFIKRELPAFQLLSVERLRAMNKEDIHSYMENLSKLKDFCAKKKMQFEIELNQVDIERKKIYASLKEKYGITTDSDLTQRIEDSEIRVVEESKKLEKMLM